MNNTSQECLIFTQRRTEWWDVETEHIAEGVRQWRQKSTEEHKCKECDALIPIGKTYWARYYGGDGSLKWPHYICLSCEAIRRAATERPLRVLDSSSGDGHSVMLDPGIIRRLVRSRGLEARQPGAGRYSIFVPLTAKNRRILIDWGFVLRCPVMSCYDSEKGESNGR